MELHKKIKKGTVVYHKAGISSNRLRYRVIDIFMNIDSEIIVVVKRVDRTLNLYHDYYDAERFDRLFEHSIKDVLNKL